jgi:hypothetical protein
VDHAAKRRMGVDMDEHLPTYRRCGRR